LVADVPVGAFLSAGVDSGTLVGLGSEMHPEPIRTVTLAFEEFHGQTQDEAPEAEAVARLFRTRHTSVTASWRDVRAGLDGFFAAMDQPTVDGLNVYWVSWAVRQAGLKAAFSGLGGDELFGTYSSYRIYPMLRRTRRLAALPGAGWLLGTLGSWMGPPRRREKLRYLSRAVATPESTYHLVRGLFTPAEIRCLVSEEVWDAAGGEDRLYEPVARALDPLPSSPWSQVAVAEQCLYMRNQLLRDADWASMAHGLEVRVPFVDREVTERLGPALAAWKGVPGKDPLAAAPRPRLPDRVRHRPKTGFGLPLKQWLGDEWRNGHGLDLPPWFRRNGSEGRISSLFAGVASGRVHWSRAWALTVLERLLAELR
jgi:asparagine synthase (glutamine-hydrolysing)